VPAEDWTDIGGGLFYALCSAGQFLFTPSQTSVTNLETSIQQFQNVFPFNLYFGIVGDLVSSTDSENVATSTPLTLKIPNLSGSGTVTLFNATSSFWVKIFTTENCNSNCATAVQTNIFDFMKMLIWLATAFILITMVLH